MDKTNIAFIGLIVVLFIGQVFLNEGFYATPPPAAPAAPPATPTKPAAPAAATGSTTQKSATPAAAAAAPAAAAAKPSGASRWLGPLAGIAAGLGIAAMLSHFGLGGAMGDFLMVALLAAVAIVGVLFVIRMIRGSSAQPAAQGAGAGTGMYWVGMR